jgi:hypothetical protein
MFQILDKRDHTGTKKKESDLKQDFYDEEFRSKTFTGRKQLENEDRFEELS